MTNFRGLFESGDPEKQKMCFQDLHKKRNSEEEYIIYARCFIEGIGVKQDIDQGIEILKGLKSDDARLLIARTLLRTTDNYDKIFKCLKKCSNKKKEANILLGFLNERRLIEGWSVENALRFYMESTGNISKFMYAKLAMQSKDPEILKAGSSEMDSLANIDLFPPAIFEMGKYTYFLDKPNHKLAKHYFTAAAEKEIILSHAYLALMYKNGHIGNSNNTNDNDKHFKRHIIAFRSYGIPLDKDFPQPQLLEESNDNFVSIPDCCSECTACKRKNHSFKQHLFQCKNCGIVNDQFICLGCYIHCHNNHDVIDFGYTMGNCSCGLIPEKCKFHKK